MLKTLTIITIIFSVTIFSSLFYSKNKTEELLTNKPTTKSYWFILHRKSNQEMLYHGNPGDIEHSKLIKTFKVKTGIPGKRPTPLPHLLGREYWIIIKKERVENNPETAPYFLTLNIPAPSNYPYGPQPYNECNGQCDWITIGAFGLHGVNGNLNKLTNEDPGSSGCIRHSDEDISFLYETLDPSRYEIRYYVFDN